MCLEVDHVTQMCTNMAGINSLTSRENDLYQRSNGDNSLIDGNPHNKSRAAYKIDEGPT